MTAESDLLPLIGRIWPFARFLENNTVDFNNSKQNIIKFFVRSYINHNGKAFERIGKYAI